MGHLPPPGYLPLRQIPPNHNLFVRGRCSGWYFRESRTRGGGMSRHILGYIHAQPTVDNGPGCRSDNGTVCPVHGGITELTLRSQEPWLWCSHPEVDRRRMTSSSDVTSCCRSRTIIGRRRSYVNVYRTSTRRIKLSANRVPQ